MSNDIVELKVLGLTYSQVQSGAYALILSQVDGPYRVPVVIGAAEAQSIAIRMENIAPPRPLTHDLFDSFSHAFGIKLVKVFIYKFEDGIFYSELTFKDWNREIVLDSRTSDAIAIAMRTKSPIYTTREILEETGFVMENPNDELPYDDEPTRTEPKLENYAIEELEASLTILIEKEEYEEAAKVKAILDAKKAARDSAEK